MTFVCNPKTTYSELVTLFLNAQRLYEVNGDDSLLENFITKNLAEFWDVTKGKNRTIVKVSEYDPAKPFGEFEAGRFMAVDCMRAEPHFYYAIVSVNSIGDIRVLKYGKCNTWEELNVIRLNNKVD